jgi:hypothetical protein
MIYLNKEIKAMKSAVTAFFKANDSYVKQFSQHRSFLMNEGEKNTR